MTPNDIQVLLHYFVWPGPHPQKDQPWVINSEVNLNRNGLLHSDESGRVYTTARADVYINALRNVPLPVQRWVLP